MRGYARSHSNVGGMYTSPNDARRDRLCLLALDSPAALVVATESERPHPGAMVGALATDRQWEDLVDTRTTAEQAASAALAQYQLAI